MSDAVNDIFVCEDEEDPQPNKVEPIAIYDFGDEQEDQEYLDESKDMKEMQNSQNKQNEQMEEIKNKIVTLGSSQITKQQNSKQLNPLENSTNIPSIKERISTGRQSRSRNPMSDTLDLKGATKIEEKKSLDMEYIQDKSVLRVSSLRVFLFTQLPQKYQLTAEIKKVETSFFDFRTVYEVLIEDNGKFLFAIEKNMSKYVFSTSKSDFDEEHQSYLGKLQFDLKGLQFQLFDGGKQCGATKQMSQWKKHLATIKYADVKGPKKFEAICTTNHNAGTLFTVLQKNTNVIREKWEHKDRKNLHFLFNQRPVYDPNDGSYRLNLQNMPSQPSIKNFVLSSQNSSTALIFSRISKTSYLMRMKSPLSVIQAAGICLSSIHGRSIVF